MLGSRAPLGPDTKRQKSTIASLCTDVRTLLYAITFGILFGFLMNKGTVFVAPTIRQQMIFQRFAMLKMFLSAVGVSMLSIAVLELCFRPAYRKVFHSYLEHNSSRDSECCRFCVGS